MRAPFQGTVALLGPSGWIGTKEDADRVYDFAFTRSKAPTPFVRAPRKGIPHFVTTERRVFARYDEEDGQEMFSLDERGSKRIPDLLPAEWAFERRGDRVLFVGSRPGKLSIEARWHVSVLGPEGVRVISQATARESVWGAVERPDGLILAVREPFTMEGASMRAKVTATEELLRGRGALAQELAGPSHGALVYLNREGGVEKREPLAGERPAGLARTPSGWILVLGEGTLAGGLRDATVQVRSPSDASFRRLVGNLHMPGQLRTRGAWSCFEERSSEIEGASLVHCIDPERAIHIMTPPLEGIVSIKDIELGGSSYVWLTRHRYQGEPRDEALAVPLP